MYIFLKTVPSFSIFKHTKAILCAARLLPCCHLPLAGPPQPEHRRSQALWACPAVTASLCLSWTFSQETHTDTHRETVNRFPNRIMRKLWVWVLSTARWKNKSQEFDGGSHLRWFWWERLEWAAVVNRKLVMCDFLILVWFPLGEFEH